MLTKKSSSPAKSAGWDAEKDPRPLFKTLAFKRKNQ